MFKACVCVCLVRRSLNETAQYFVKKKKIFSVILEFERTRVKQPAAAYSDITCAWLMQCICEEKVYFRLKSKIIFTKKL